MSEQQSPEPIRAPRQQQPLGQRPINGSWAVLLICAIVAAVGMFMWSQDKADRDYQRQVEQCQQANPDTC